MNDQPEMLFGPFFSWLAPTVPSVGDFLQGVSQAPLHRLLEPHRPSTTRLSHSIVIAPFPLFYHQTKLLTYAQKEAVLVKILSFQVQEPSSNPSSCIHKLCTFQSVSKPVCFPSVKKENHYKDY